MIMTIGLKACPQLSFFFFFCFKFNVKQVGEKEMGLQLDDASYTSEIVFHY